MHWASIQSGRVHGNREEQKLYNNRIQLSKHNSLCSLLAKRLLSFVKRQGDVTQRVRVPIFFFDTWCKHHNRNKHAYQESLSWSVVYLHIVFSAFHISKRNSRTVSHFLNCIVWRTIFRNKSIPFLPVASSSGTPVTKFRCAECFIYTPSWNKQLNAIAVPLILHFGLWILKSRSKLFWDSTSLLLKWFGERAGDQATRLWRIQWCFL